MKITSLRARGLFLFYKKTILPVLALSITLFAGGKATIENYNSINFGIIFMAIFFLYQYLVYDVINHSEYYLYFNLGLSKKFLWLTTLGLGLIVLFISIIIHYA